jgi:hypothetical protein
MTNNSTTRKVITIPAVLGVHIWRCDALVRYIILIGNVGESEQHAGCAEGVGCCT